MYERDVFSERFEEQAGKLMAFARFLQDIPRRADPVEVIERCIGRAIQEIVQEHYNLVPAEHRATLGRVPVGNNVVLDQNEVELYRSPRFRIGHSIGNPPLLPEYWVRNYQGILDYIVRGCLITKK